MATIENALSGIRSAEYRVAVAAQNIANATTKNFKALDYTQTSNGDGGVRGEVTTRNPATIVTIDGSGNPVQVPNVALDQELLNTQIAINDFQANATVLKTAKDLQKNLIDILA